MKTEKIVIFGREFALAFTLSALGRLEDDISDFNLSKLSEYVRSPNGMLTILEALAEQGEMLEGRKLDVDKEWFGNHISPAPKRIASIQVAIFNALSEGLKMDTEDDEGEEKDLVLEEIKKKEMKAD